MTTHLKLIGIGSILLVMGFLLSAYIAKANPSFFIQNTSSSATACSLTASTTRTWMTGGTATTTIALNASGCGGSQAIDSAELLLYRFAAAPTSKTNVTIQFSQNCDATSPDWYFATSSIGTFTSVPSQMSWTFASSTIGGEIAASDFDTVAIPITTPTKCVRAILTVPVGAASSSIYADFVGKRQSNY